MIFFLSPAPSCWLLLACLPCIVPRPRAWEAWVSCLLAVCGCRVRFACVACVPCRSLAIARLLLSRHRPCCRCSPCGFPRCLLGGGDVIPAGVLVPHRFSCLPVIRYPSGVIRLMWLVVMSGGGLSCCPLPFAFLSVSFARCRL